MKTVRIATRKSALALWQAEHVKHELQYHHPDIDVELIRITSQGDRILDAPLTKVGGKALFVKELENALLAGHADIAVHSMKDIPAQLPGGLDLGAICLRGDPRDAFLSNNYATLNDLPKGAVVGTSSLRRQCQILAACPDLTVKFLRGNINTRLARLDDGLYDAIILSAAGLIRLGMAERIRDYLETNLSLPAAGQGAIAIELRQNDEHIRQLIAPLHDQKTSIMVGAERAMIKHLNGGCQVPIGGLAELDGDQLFLRGLVGSPDGKTIYRSATHCDLADYESAGIWVAESLLKQGADKILAELAHH